MSMIPEAAYAMLKRVYKGDHVNLILCFQTLADCFDAVRDFHCRIQ